MKVLVLDDDEKRLSVFRSALPSAVCVKTAKACIEKLNSDDFDFVFLDHDLDGRVFVDTDEKETGSEVVRWLVANKKNAQARYIIHTLNFKAANHMFHTLTNNGFSAETSPFGTINFDSLYRTLNSFTP